LLNLGLIDSTLILTHSMHHVSVRPFFRRVCHHLCLEALSQQLILLQSLIFLSLFSEKSFIIYFLLHLYVVQVLLPLDLFLSTLFLKLVVQSISKHAFLIVIVTQVLVHQSLVSHPTIIFCFVIWINCDLLKLIVLFNLLFPGLIPHVSLVI